MIFLQSIISNINLNIRGRLILGLAVVAAIPVIAISTTVWKLVQMQV